jgi:hypothetical protein
VTLAELDLVAYPVGLVATRSKNVAAWWVSTMFSDRSVAVFCAFRTVRMVNHAPAGGLGRVVWAEVVAAVTRLRHEPGDYDSSLK